MSHPVIPLDDALDAARGQRPAPNGQPQAPSMTVLSRLLRTIGAVALLASASTFLVQRWETGGDLMRYFTLLAHPALVAALGVLCGTRGRDAKSARTFLTLAAAFVPVVACLLGGLVYSQFAWDAHGAALPGYAMWVAPSPAAALLALGISAAVCAPVVTFAFLALARTRARVLAAAYLAANATLLIPTRDPTAVALLAMLSLCAAGLWERLVLRRDTALSTLEGAFVRAMLFVPPALVLIRNVLHYEVSHAFFALVAGTAAIGWLALAAIPRLPEVLRGMLRGASLVSLLAASGFASAAAVSVGVPETLAIPACALSFALGAFAFSLLAGEARWGDGFRHTGVVVALGGMLLDLWLSPDVLTSAGCFVIATATLSYGYLARRRALFLAGCAGVLFALSYHVRYAVMFYAYTRWGSLALLGVGVILGASYLERNGEHVLTGLRELRSHLAQWA